MSTNKINDISKQEKGKTMKQALCLIAVFFLLTAAKEGSMTSTDTSKSGTTAQQAAANGIPDQATLALLSDPGFQALFGKGGLFDGTKQEVDNRIAAIEAMTKLGPALQDPNFVASMQAMSAQQGQGATAAAPTYTPTASAKKRTTY